MFLSADLTAAIELVLTNLHSSPAKIILINAVAGGSINYCFKVKTTTGTYFIKTNSASKFPDLFLSEAEGLRRIRNTNTIAVPDVIGHGRTGDEIFLILNWINSSTQNKKHYHLGQQLAKMHRHSSDRFGLDHDNFMGSLPQKNSIHFDWLEFFLNERINPQLELAFNKNLINREIVRDFHCVFDKIAVLFPVVKPSLVHGDLWSGNYLFSDDGTPYLIDPAVYYGNREVDLAMSTLFGGFSPEFYTGYQDEFPLQNGWEARLDILNLYPLLVHLNLFGEGYLGQIKSILRKFVI